MSRFYIAEGIVLKRKNVGEADRIITLFTKEFGKVRVLAKGIRRITSRRAGHLELFSHVKISLRQGKGIDLLTEASRLGEGNEAYGRNLINISYAYYLCELIDRLTAEGQEHKDLFDLLVQSIERTSRKSSLIDQKRIAYDFAREVLWRLGYLPRSIVLAETKIGSYIERITERKLKSPSILTIFDERE